MFIKLGKFHDILKKLPLGSFHLSDDSGNTGILQLEDNDKLPVHTEKSRKGYVTANSTNVVTWALLEAIETTEK